MRDNDSLILEKLYSTILENSGLDAKYAELEQRSKDGDEEAEAEAQKMVDEAAKKSEYNIADVFHGSPTHGFTVFTPQTDITGSIRNQGVHVFSKGTEIPRRYSGSKGEIRKFFLNVNNPFDHRNHDQVRYVLRHIFFNRNNYLDMETPNGVVPDLYKLLEDKSKDYETVNKNDTSAEKLFKLASAPDYEFVETSGVPQVLKELGYDGYITIEGGELVYGVFDSFQIKSATPFTYDNGELIPLSQRFDSSNDDIRYWLSYIPND